MWIEFPDQGKFSREWLEQHPEQGQVLLARSKGRYPLCLCREPGLPLYIARRQRLYLARLPNTGPLHAPQCPAYEPEAALCGWSLYSKKALHESVDGALTIKLSTPLLIRAGAATAPITATATSSERATLDAMGLTGLLHLLWERSEFNRWHPAMRGRRRYRQWRKYTLETAENLRLNRQPLTQHLYVPERYLPEAALEIEARRQRDFARLGKTARGSPQRILVLGKVRSLVPDRGLRLAHLPAGLVIGLDAALRARLHQLTSFAWLDGRSLHPEFQLFVLLTMRRSHDLCWLADAITALISGPEFIPLLSIEDSLMCRRLIDEQRAFYKPLPYDASAAQVPNFILTDTGPSSVPLEIVSEAPAAAALHRSRMEIYETTQRRFWVWDVSEQPLAPPLPVAE